MQKQIGHLNQFWYNVNCQNNKASTLKNKLMENIFLIKASLKCCIRNFENSISAIMPSKDSDKVLKGSLCKDLEDIGWSWFVLVVSEVKSPVSPWELLECHHLHKFSAKLACQTKSTKQLKLYAMAKLANSTKPLLHF